MPQPIGQPQRFCLSGALALLQGQLNMTNTPFHFPKAPDHHGLGFSVCDTEEQLQIFREQ